MEYCQKALEIKQKIYGKPHPDIAISSFNAGWLLAALGNYPQALEYCNVALDIYFDFYGEEHYYTKEFRRIITVIEARLRNTNE